MRAPREFTCIVCGRRSHDFAQLRSCLRMLRAERLAYKAGRS